MSGMKIIKPTVITDAMLTGSSVAEPADGEVAWSAATAYAKGAVVIRTTTHRQYERLVAGTTATAPEADPVNWMDIGPTSRWAMFDRKVGTETAAASLTVTMQPGGVSGIGALELTGRELRVQMKDAPGGTVIYDRTVSLDGTLIESVYDWFFADFEQLTDVVLTDMPQHYAGCELTYTQTGTSGVAVGVLLVGQVIEIGRAQYGASVGIIDYSRKEKDQFGNLDVIERTYSKRSSLQVITEKAKFNKIYRTLASLRATPCIYLGADQAGYEPMITYGFYKDFGIAVPYPNHHLLNIEIEGLS